MKTRAILLATVCAGLCAAALPLLAQDGETPREAAAATDAEADAGEKPIDPAPYPLTRFQRLMSNTPFDFDPPPKVVEAPIPPMVDWMIAGISGTVDYTSVTIVNAKSNQRLTLTKYTNPELDSKKGKKDATGDAFKLQGIEFEPGKPRSRKHAKAYVQKNNEPVGEVTWQAKADQMKPMVNAPNIQMPKNLPVNMGNTGGMAATGQPMAGQPGQNTAANAAMNPQLAAIGQAGTQPNGQPTLPGAGNVSNGQAALLDLLNNRNKGGATQAAGQTGAAASPLGRRRVVLPTGADAAPAPPVVNQ